MRSSRFSLSHELFPSPSTVRPGAFTGVIFAASASAKGGDALAVDRDGVISAARCCISASVPRFVLVSSGAVTRPDSAVYQLLNLVGKGIMKAKIEGEDALRDMYARAPRDAGAYTIVRPGGLTTGDALGPEALELNQGDDKSGRIFRAPTSLASVSLLSPIPPPLTQRSSATSSRLQSQSRASGSRICSSSETRRLTRQDVSGAGAHTLHFSRASLRRAALGADRKVLLV